MMSNATEEASLAVTAVFWDMNKCPVPADFDHRLVRPGIKRFLEKKGYHGPLIITAFGELTSVPVDTLRGVYCTGISLANSPCPGALEEKKDICSEKDCFACSEKDESDCFVWSACGPEAAFGCFEDFITHLYLCGRMDR